MMDFGQYCLKAWPGGRKIEGPYRGGSKEAVQNRCRLLVSPSVEHIENWLEQFDEDVRLPLVAELGHILPKSYFSGKATADFWKRLVTAKKLVGDDPVEFWKKANFFDAQQGGASQSELLEFFGTLLKSESGIRRKECGSKSGPVIYIDDVLFSGNRLVNDLRHWIPNEARKSCEFHAIFIGTHSGGAFYARKAIEP